MTDFDFDDEAVARYGELFNAAMAGLEFEDQECKYSREYLTGAAIVLVMQTVIDDVESALEGEPNDG